jgi:hypothetical protein
MQELVTGLDTSLGECFAPHSQYAICASHDILEKHHQLELEENYGIDRRTTSTRIGLLHELTHKREIKRSLQIPVEMIAWYQLLYGDIAERSKVPLFGSHHRIITSADYGILAPFTFHSLAISRGCQQGVPIAVL